MFDPRTLLTRWLPVVVWATLIFVGSSDLLAARHTSRFVVPFLYWLFGANLTPEWVEFFHHLVRKGGHLCEYAVLCVLLWRALAGLHCFHGPAGSKRSRWLSPSAVLGAALYAASDEFHQSFVPTRAASVYDMQIDTAGAVFGLGVYLASAYLGSRWRAARPLKPSQARS